MNEKKVNARRGNTAAAKEPSIAREMTQTKVCFAGYFLPSKNVSDWRVREREGTNTVYPMPIKSDAKSFRLEISVDCEKIVLIDNISESKSEE
jgi:hypothetical protein